MKTSPRKVCPRAPAFIEPLESRIAPASTVSVTSGNLTVQDANANALDAITISFAGGNFTFSDGSGNTITAGAGATQVNPSVVTVPAASVSGTMSIQLGEGNNMVSFGNGLPSLLGITVDAGKVGPLPALVVGNLGLDVTSATSDITVGGVIDSSGFISLFTLGTTSKLAINANVTASADILLQTSLTVGMAGGVTIQAAKIGIHAGGDVGSAATPLALSTPLLAVSIANGNAGGIFVTDPVALTIGTVTDAAFAFTADGLSAMSGDISVACGDVLTVNSPVQSGSGNITLSSFGDLHLNAPGPATSGNVHLIATANSGGTGGAITENLSFGINASQLTVNAALGFSLNSAASSLSLTSGSGGIVINQAPPIPATIVALNAGTGSVTLNGGTFSLGAGGTIAGAPDLTLTGTLDLNGLALAVGALSGSGTVLNNGQTPSILTVGASNDSGSFSGVLKDGSSILGLTKTGTGMQTFTGPSTFSGGTDISMGSILIAHPAALGTGTISINDSSTGANDTALLATAVMNGNDLSHGSLGAIQNSIIVQNQGTGTTTIGTTSFSGNLASGQDSTDFAGSITLQKTVIFQGGNTDVTNYLGVISGSGGVTIGGGGKTALNNAANTFLGNVDITGTGTVLVAKTGSLPATASVSVGAAALFDIFGNVSIDVLTGSGNVQSVGGVGNLTIGASGGTGTFDGVIQDGLKAMGITKTGTGTETFTGTNTYTGGTTINGGILEFDALGSALNGHFDLGGGILGYNIAGSNTINPTGVVLHANSSVEVAAGTGITWKNAPVSGAGFTFTKLGDGALIKSGSTFGVSALEIAQGAFGTDRSGGLGTASIDIQPAGALWIQGAVTLANPITLNGGMGAVNAPGGLPGVIRHILGGTHGPANLTGSITLSSGDSVIRADGGDIVFKGMVTGTGNLTLQGESTIVLANAKNTFGSPTSTITIDASTLEVSSAGALGNAGNTLVFESGTLRTTAGFTIVQHISRASGNAILNVAGVVTLAGVVDGPGAIVKSGTGTIKYGTNFTGDTQVTNSGITIGSTSVSISGSGTLTATAGPDGSGGTEIQSITLSGTSAGSKIVINGPKQPGHTVTLDQIISSDPTNTIGSITLGPSVIFGNGVNDNIPDMAVAGEVGKLTFSDINPYAILRLGSGLPYHVGIKGVPDTYNDHPKLTIRNVLGPGVTVDMTNDGTAGGVGGGGLGKVTVNSWAFAGVIKTTQSVASFKLKQGNCYVDFELDPNHLGEFTTASIGNMTIANGAWGSTNSEIEGNVGSFSAGAFLAGASITAGSMTKLVVRKGVYAGTTTLTDATGHGMKVFTVNGDFQGYVSSTGSISSVSVKGNFKGSLSAISIGSISAFTFDGTTTGDLFGDPLRQNIVATGGSLGKLSSLDGGIVNYEIAALTSFGGISVKDAAAIGGMVGLDKVSVEAGNIGAITVALRNAAGVIGIRDSFFETNSFGLGTIASITSSHSVVNSTFAASTSLGAVMIGTADPTAALSGSQLLAGTSLANATLGGPAAGSYSRAGAIASVTVKGAVTATTIAAGIDPGDGIYGNGNDIAAAGAPTVPYAIGALIFGGGSGTMTGSPSLSHDNAIEAASIKSMALHGVPVIKTFTTPGFLEVGGSEAASDILVQLI